MSTVGFLGLGVMGRAMAGRLLDAGHEVIVWNRSQGPVDELVARGAHRAEDAAEALRAAISFSMLANDAAVEAVFTDDVISAGKGNLHVMMASITPTLGKRNAERFEKAGVRYLAATVLGRPEVAQAGNLNVLAAGRDTDIDEAQPFFDIFGQRTWRLAEAPEVANAVKAAVNYNIIHAMQAIGESVAMTERLGVKPELFTDLLASTLFGGVVYKGYGDLIARQQYEPPGFHVALGRKDLGLAQEVAESVGIEPATLPALISVFDAALADPEMQNGDWSVIAEVTRRQ